MCIGALAGEQIEVNSDAFQQAQKNLEASNPNQPPRAALDSKESPIPIGVRQLRIGPRSTGAGLTSTLG